MVTIGSRGSALALWQARHVAGLLHERHPGLGVETRVVRTDGDLQEADAIAEIGTGVFVRRLEQSLLAGEIDLAVHSLKDMPTRQPAGLCIAAVPERHDPRDALLTLKGETLDQLRPGTVVGTGSPRRRGQLLHVRPDLSIVALRGNVDTRVERLRRGDLGALVLALAGVERLGIHDVCVAPLDPRVCLPAVGQGAIALETREDDAETRALLEDLSNERLFLTVAAERAFLERLGGGCLAPATAHASLEGGHLRLEALVVEFDGSAVLIERERAPIEQAEAVGQRLAQRLLAAGAGEVLERARSAGASPAKPSPRG